MDVRVDELVVEGVLRVHVVVQHALQYKGLDRSTTNKQVGIITINSVSDPDPLQETLIWIRVPNKS